MPNYVVCLCTFRIVLPILISLCIVFRPSVLSSIYLLFLFYLPLIPIPSKRSMSGSTGLYLKFLIFISILTCCGQFAFQMLFLWQIGHDQNLKFCSFYETLLRHIGFVSMHRISFTSALTWLTPELLLCLTSIFIYTVCVRLTLNRPIIFLKHDAMLRLSSRRMSKTTRLVEYVGRYRVLSFLCLSAIINPSIIGAFYFMIFLFTNTWFAISRWVPKIFIYGMRFLMLIVFLHSCAFYVYQMQWIQNLLPTHNVNARYFGLTTVFDYNCEDPRNFLWVYREWSIYINLIALYLFYYLLAIESQRLANRKFLNLNPLPKATSPIINECANECCKKNFMDKFLKILNFIGRLPVKYSYIGTNIVMMVWSIAYVSWITFVLLLWANFLWLIPDQRKAILRSSPYLVIYTSFLMCISYIYSIDLTENELPTIKGQYGFDRITNYRCTHLLIKCIFMCFFWETLKQYRKNKNHKNSKKYDEEDETLRKISYKIRILLSKLWAWIIVSTLFLVAITGDRMTLFRIVYMSLFLIFIINFQISVQIWKRITLVFWFTIILFSMITLVMIYSYQFDTVQLYWSKYIDKEHHLAIGLEKYEFKQLFIRLLIPTILVIITASQIHYFNKHFMVLSNFQNQKIDENPPSTTSILNESKFENSQSLWSKYSINTINLTLLFLKIHSQKLVFLMAMMVCLQDTTAIYSVILLIIILVLTLGQIFLYIALYSTLILISFVIIIRMIYQMDYIKKETWDIVCQYGGEKIIKNNAEWLGFVKSKNNENLFNLIQWEMYFIFVLTFWSIIKMYQFRSNLEKNQPNNLMFPNVTWTDAHGSLIDCLKYLANYGFYKFGVEICLIVTVALIGIRMDMYSVFYSIWLCVLFSLTRNALAKIWDVYVMFIAVFLIIQYLIAVGPPPTFCIVLPWNTYYWLPTIPYVFDIYVSWEKWCFLPNAFDRPPPQKLICDFVLLYVATRQSAVFRIEKKYSNQNYPGGSNEPITHLAEDWKFKNPAPDFVTYLHDWLDVLKRAVLLSFIWVTLAVLFLTGASRVNIFSLGYLFGAFIFLWYGSDLYLRPLPKIIRSWNWLIGYNVTVILLKSLSQIIGCIYYKEVAGNVCWLIRLFAIGCVKKFDETDDDGDNKLLCEVPDEYIGLGWDSCCFGFLIFQRRIFHSTNFFHIINETKATAILATRGAKLIEELHLRRIVDQQEEERAIIEKIRGKMEKIKATQQRVLGSNYEATSNHYIAVNSGDYYMFEDNDVTEIEPMSESDSEDEESLTRPTGKFTFGQLLTTAMKTDIAKTVRLQSETDMRHKLDLSRQSSMMDIHSQKSISFKPTYDSLNEAKLAKLFQTDAQSEFSSDKIPKKTWFEKSMDLLLFVKVFLESIIVSLINFLNRYSRDYRYVLRVLAKERKILKETTHYSVGLRLGIAQIWQPSASYHELLKEHTGTDSQMNVIAMYHDEMFFDNQPIIIRLLLAVWYIIMSRSELMCYFVIFLNQIKTASYLSLPLPLMVLFWGTLAIPRPNKTFWVTLIAYTELIVLIKCFFQFEIIPGSQMYVKDQLNPMELIGIQRIENYASYDLLVLLALFFHRFLLKSMGLWQSDAVQTAVIPSGDYQIDKNGKLKPVKTAIYTLNRRMSYKLKKIHDLTPSSDSPGSNERVKKKKVLITYSKIKGYLQTESAYSMKYDSYDEYSEVNSGNSIGNLDDEERSVFLQSVPIDSCSDFPRTLIISCGKYAESIKLFFKQLITPTSRIGVDIYSYMFLCDFFNVFVIIFGFSSFSIYHNEKDVSSYITENNVPIQFLLISFLQFLLIIIDRGIYLRKNVLAKTVFQFIQVISLHVWFFLVNPLITETPFNAETPPQIYYMVKCFYFLLSAYQIRCGYPTRILGNFLCKGYNYVNMLLFRAYLALPFVYELRNIMDWMWTDTSMTVMEWFKMEDIFASIFIVKCNRYVEDEFPQTRGEKKNSTIKYLTGILLLALVISIIFFPLVFFWLGNAIGSPNIPKYATLQVGIDYYTPLYEISASANAIYTFTRADFNDFHTIYNKDKSASDFISHYEAKDVAVIKFAINSATIWNISPPDRENLLQKLSHDGDVNVILECKILQDKPPPTNFHMLSEKIIVPLPSYVNVEDKNKSARWNLQQMLEGNTSDGAIIPRILPKFLKILNRGTVVTVDKLMSSSPDEAARSYRDVKLQLNGTSPREWWSVEEICDDYNYKKYLKRIEYGDNCRNIVVYTFNDRTFLSTLTFISRGGIIGLYALYFFAAIRIVKSVLSDQVRSIWLDNMPFTDRIYKIVNDIYIVRAEREYALEEDLFAKLLFLMRSRELAIEMTRRPENIYDRDLSLK